MNLKGLRTIVTNLQGYALAIADEKEVIEVYCDVAEFIQDIDFMPNAKVVRFEVYPWMDPEKKEPFLFAYIHDTDEKESITMNEFFDIADVDNNVVGYTDIHPDLSYYLVHPDETSKLSAEEWEATVHAVEEYIKLNVCAVHLKAANSQSPYFVISPQLPKGVSSWKSGDTIDKYK